VINKNITYKEFRGIFYTLSATEINSFSWQVTFSIALFHGLASFSTVLLGQANPSAALWLQRTLLQN